MPEDFCAPFMLHYFARLISNEAEKTRLYFVRMKIKNIDNFPEGKKQHQIAVVKIFK